MLVRRAVTQCVGSYIYGTGSGVVALVGCEAMRGVREYVRQVGKSMPTLARRAVMPCVGGYLYQMGGGVLGLVRRAVGFLQFEDGWDAAGYICLSLGLTLMLLGTVAAPDVPAAYLWADDDDPNDDGPGGLEYPVATTGQCPGEAACDTGCKLQPMGQCTTSVGTCGQFAGDRDQDCVYCLCAERDNDNSGFYCICK